METVYIIGILIFIVFMLVTCSKFTNITDTYSGCDYKSNSLPFPSGNLPGSYLGLSSKEKDELLRRFIEEN